MDPNSLERATDTGSEVKATPELVRGKAAGTSTPQGALSSEAAEVRKLQRLIGDECVRAVGLSPDGRLGRALSPVLRAPTARFARIATDVESRLQTSGLVSSMQWLLSQYVVDIDVRGAGRVPKTGPLLVASNHPGTFDAIAILASLGRDDARIVMSDVPLTRALPAASEYMIYVAPGTHGRMAALRSMIRSLKAGHALVVFPSGIVDPDPDLLPGAEASIESWSPSVALTLRQVPEARLMTAIVSGVLAGSSLRNPLTRVIRPEWRQRKLAEFLQVGQQIVLSRKYDLKMRITYGHPRDTAELGDLESSESSMTEIRANARSVLAEHLARDRG